METEYIITNLKTASFKFTKANQFRDKIRKLPSEDRERIVRELKKELQQQCNADIYQPLSELLFRLDSIAIDDAV